MSTSGTNLHSHTNSAFPVPAGTRRKRFLPSSHGGAASKVLLVLSDFLSFWVIACLLIAARLGPGETYLHTAIAIVPHLWFTLLYSILILLISHAQGLYSLYQSSSWTKEAFIVFKSVSFATLLIMATIYMSRSLGLSRLVIATNGVLSFVTMAAWRQLRRRALHRTDPDGLTRHNVLIVGTDSLAQTLRSHLLSDRNLGLVVLGLLSPHSRSSEPHCIGTLQDLPRLCRTHFVDEVILCGQDREIVKSVFERAREYGVGVRVVPDLYDGIAWGAEVDYIGVFPAFGIVRREIPVLELKIKRLLDMVLAAAGLVFLTPLLLVVAILIKIDSHGPLVYSSRRVGRKGRIFSCYKFRSMVLNADIQKANLQHLNERDGVLFKIQSDPRVTRIGRFLRKYSIDELPQLWNVLKGDMSLVGPRPPLTVEVKQYKLEYHRRLEAAPGITGLWQVEARTSPSFNDYISLDLYYVKNWSIWLDLKILFRTVVVVLRGTGS